MKPLESLYFNKKLQIQSTYFKEDHSQRHGTENIYISIRKLKKHKKIKTHNYPPQPYVIFNRISRFVIPRYKTTTRMHSSVNMHSDIMTPVSRRNASLVSVRKKTDHPLSSESIRNLISEHLLINPLNPFTQEKVYQKLSIAEESCYSSRNSDVLFVSIHNRNKKKCDNNHVHLGELRKSPGVLLDSASKLKRKPVKKAENIQHTKFQVEKEFFLTDNTKQPIPSERKIARKKIEKHNKADVGLPPETNNVAEKSTENKLKNLVAINIPEEITPSQKNNAAFAISKDIQSEKSKRFKAADLITSVEEQSPNSKEKAIRAAMEHLVLPNSKVSSKQNFVENVCADLDLPPEYINKVNKDEHTHTAIAGLLQQIKGEAPKEKEHIIKGLHELPVPLHVELIPYGKHFINKINPWTAIPQFYARYNVYLIMSHIGSKSQEVKGGIVKLTPNSKIKNANAADLVLRTDRISQGNGKMPPGIKLLDEVHAELDLSSEPTTSAMSDKHAKSTKTGVLRQIVGKSLKKKTLKSLTAVGIPQLEGSVIHISAKRPSEKVIAVKVKGKTTPSISSKNFKKPKAFKLLTPLKTIEKQPRELSDISLPIPDRRNSSGKTSQKLEQVLGKTATQKEKVFIGRSTAGLQLIVTNKPQSVRASVQNTKENTRYDTILPLEGLRKDKVARKGKGLSMNEKHVKNILAATSSASVLTLSQEPKSKFVNENAKEMRKIQETDQIIPLQKKNPAQNISRNLANTGLPLPTRSTTEKVLTVKIKARKEFKGPPKEIKRVPALLTPPEIQTTAVRENGIPLPERNTSYNNSLVYKIGTDLGIPHAKTLCEKEKVEEVLMSLAGSENDLLKKTTARTGLPTVSSSSSETMQKNKNKIKMLGVISAKIPKAFEKRVGTKDIPVTVKTTCERGCGCDKKKIKFKNSYVKIKLGTPDISFSDYSNAAVNTEGFISTGGIRFTVGSAVGVPSYLRDGLDNNIPQKELLDEIYFKYGSVTTGNTDHEILFNHFKNNTLCSNKEFNIRNDATQTANDTIFRSIKSTNSDGIHCIYTANHTSDDIIDSYIDTSYKRKTSCEEEEEDPCEYLKKNIFRLSSNIYQESFSNETFSSKSMTHYNSQSLILTSASPTLSLSTSKGSVDTSSLLSMANSDSSSNRSIHYFGCQLSSDLFSDPQTDSNTDDSYYSSNKSQEVKVSFCNSVSEESVLCDEYLNVKPTYVHRDRYVYQIFRMAEHEVNPLFEKKCILKHKTKNGEPIVVINHLNSERDIMTIVDELLAKNDFSGVSSIFVVVPSEDNGVDSSSDFIPISENQNLWRGGSVDNFIDSDVQRRSSATTNGLKISAKGQKFLMDNLPTTVLSFHNKETMFDSLKFWTFSKRHKNKLCQITTPSPNDKSANTDVDLVNTETNVTLPYCCCLNHHQCSQFCTYEPNQQQMNERNQMNEMNYSNDTNKMWDQVTPLLVSHGMNVEYADPFFTPKLKSQPRKSATTLTLFRTQATLCDTPPCNNLTLRNNQSLCDTPPCNNLVLQNNLPLCDTPPRNNLPLCKNIPPCPNMPPCHNTPPCHNVPSCHETSPCHQIPLCCTKPPSNEMSPSHNIPSCHNIPPCLPDDHPCNEPTTTTRPEVTSCDCNTEKLKELLEQALGTKMMQDKKSVYLKECRDIDTQTLKRPSNTTVATKTEGNVEDCASCQHPPTVDECGCNGKKKRIKLKSVCPCQAYQKARPRKLNAQPCPASGQTPTTAVQTNANARPSVISHLIPIRQPGQIQIIGPAGESMEIETGKIYTQAATKQAKFTCTTGTSTEHDLDYKSKHGKKAKNVICECPEEEHDGLVLVLPEPKPDADTNQFEWVDLREVKKMKSDLTHRISGFTMQTKRPPPPTDEDGTIDDALKYYAAMYPDLFQRILKEQLAKQPSPPPPPPSLETTDEKPLRNIIKVSKQPKTKVYCEWPEGVALLPLRSVKAIPSYPREEISPFSRTLSSRSESTLSESQYNKGPVRCLNFKIPSKGTGSPGLADIYFYDLLQGSFTTW